ncbi:hypothetical protein CN520_06190 [Bacillus cereus]|uniref:Uncharacterized protein n=3 Tax=Bacillus cereus group TaxID=86661 RepID=A0A9X7B8Y7_BACCE|nr:hypothetical protein BK701_04230 [Bacillus thuringiensis serovar amagiensis]OTW78211.1 hypothetical protein BK713_24275 [Bacillus thuringiensis serovar jinghongiensis]OTX11415.1 hypothetical protein BK715_31405 [Bacillus thuringiensis serovar japonensis]OTX22848.1 hypothetical protein BK718_26450 [Bacillus thuringiensis serovar andalousiensis]OTX88921.1 hypothetical protein BK726_13335 [Bacillus thuringiensis serovar londrina]OTY51438.1 hypothetical protein BK746_32610 [Bacillus thuringiens
MFSYKFCTVRSFKHSCLYIVKKYFHSLYFQAFMSLFQNIIRFTLSIEISTYHNRKHYFQITNEVILV